MNAAIHPTHVVRRLSVTSEATWNEQNTDRVIDIFPHRLHPAEGVTKDDMVLTLIAMLDGMNTGDYRGSSNISCITTCDLNHPYGQYAQGSVLCTPGRDDSAEQIVITDSEVRLPDGLTYPLESFGHRPYGPIEASQASNGIKAFHKTLQDDKLPSILTGMVDEILPAPFSRDFRRSFTSIVQIVAARIPRLVNLGRAEVGYAASLLGHTSAYNYLRDLDWMWICPPDRGYDPTMRVHGSRWPEVLQHCDQELVAAGRAIYGKLEDLREDSITETFLLWGDDKDLSNHQRILMKQVLARIDEAIEDCMPAHMLKPAAARRVQRRTKT